MLSKLDLSLAISQNPRTQAIIDGIIAPQSITLHTSVLHPSEMFWRQLKFAEFDISEMSLASLFIAVSRGDMRWVAIPVFTMRSFFHTWGLARRDRGIHSPGDLKGKRVGVPEYQQTSAIWSRGIFQDEFGLDPRDVEWFMERSPDKSHGGSTGFEPPQGVRLNQIPPTSDIGSMLSIGELDATLLYLRDPNLVDRSSINLSSHPDIMPIFPDNPGEGHRYFRKTGIFPINHTLVVRRTLLETHPWVALNIYSAFLEAKNKSVKDARESLAPWFDSGALRQADNATLDMDPMPYGFKAASPVLRTIARYLHQQGLTAKVCEPEDMFAASTIGI